MKVKEITLGESEITVKPLPGAQQLSVDGKPVGQANDPALAQQITQAAKDGKLTLNDPTKATQPTMGVQEEPASSKNTYFVDTSKNPPMAKTKGNTPDQPITPSKMWTAITPEIEAKAHDQGFIKVYLSVNGKIIPGLEGGGKLIVAPSDFQSMSTPGAGTMRRPMGVQSAEKTGIGAPPLRESKELDAIKKLSGL